MSKIQYSLSKNEKRNKIYTSFLESCRKGNATVNDIIHMGYKLMRKGKIHHHFFGDCSLLATSEYLAHHSLSKQQAASSKQQAASSKNNNDLITEKEATEIISLFERRISERIPVEYITNEASYSGYKFYINENVLVPRSIMSTRFNDFLNEINWENNRVLDLCAGSGCIGITLALLNAKIQVNLADISAAALEVAQINVDKYSLNDRVRCIQSDLFDNIQDKYDLIITNPPYVSIREYEKCPQEFKNEPKIALESGKDGLDILHKILSQAKKHLNTNGVLIAEVGFTAAKLLKKKYPRILFKWFKYRRPNGKESIFGMDCILYVKKNDLPNFIRSD